MCETKQTLTKQTLGREEEADLMLKHTSITPGLARFLAGAFVLMICSVPFLHNILGSPPRDAKTSADGMAAPPTGNVAVPVSLEQPRNAAARGLWSWLPDAAQLRKFETKLEERSALFSRLRPRTQGVLSGVLRAGNEKVYIGHDGWLFYRPAVDYLTSPGFLEAARLEKRLAVGNSQPDPVRAILDFKRQLGERGIQLIVMPVPVKATIYPEKLWPRYSPLQEPPQNPSFAQFKRRLEAEGVLVFDPTELLWRAKQCTGAPQFLPTDTHWTPVAVETAAAGLAATIKLFIPLPARQPVPYSQRTAQGPAPVDLVRLLGLPPDQTLYRAQSTALREVRTPQGTLCRPQRDADVLLLGDSFTGAYQEAGAGLAEQLSFALQRPVDRIAFSNGGSNRTRLRLRQDLLRGEDRLAGKRLVIWEFTARDLSLGDWKILALPSPTPTLLAQAPETRIARQKARNSKPETRNPKLSRRSSRRARKTRSRARTVWNLRGTAPGRSTHSLRRPAQRTPRVLPEDEIMPSDEIALQPRGHV